MTCTNGSTLSIFYTNFLWAPWFPSELEKHVSNMEPLLSFGGSGTLRVQAQTIRSTAFA